MNGKRDRSATGRSKLHPRKLSLLSLSFSHSHSLFRMTVVVCVCGWVANGRPCLQVRAPAERGLVAVPVGGEAYREAHAVATASHHSRGIPRSSRGWEKREREREKERQGHGKPPTVLLYIVVWQRRVLLSLFAWISFLSDREKPSIVDSWRGRRRCRRVDNLTLELPKFDQNVTNL